jgi:hypothetical protein
MCQPIKLHVILEPVAIRLEVWIDINHVQHLDQHVDKSLHVFAQPAFLQGLRKYLDVTAREQQILFNRPEPWTAILKASHAHHLIASNDQMIEQGHVELFCEASEPHGESDVILAWSRIAARVIVDKDETGGAEREAA